MCNNVNLLQANTSLTDNLSKTHIFPSQSNIILEPLSCLTLMAFSIVFNLL